MFLAPLTAELTTIKHCQFRHRCSPVINDGNQADGGLLEQLQAAKESLRSPANAADNDGTSASPKEAKRTDEWPEPNWIPWIIGSCLAGGSLAYVFAGENIRLRASRPRAKRQGSPIEGLLRPPLYGIRP